MGNLTKVRVGTDVHLYVTVKDTGIPIGWNTANVVAILNKVKPSKGLPYSFEGIGRNDFIRCDTFLTRDNTVLDVFLPASKQRFVDYQKPTDMRLTLTVTINGSTSTYDAVAFTFVPLSEMLGDNPSQDNHPIDLELEINEVSSSEVIRMVEECKAILAEDVANESTRQYNEAIRIANEEQRELDETERQNAESNRETTFENNESLRQETFEANEAERIQAEEQRAQRFETVVKDAQDATDRANAAAEAVEPYENRLENVEGKVTELEGSTEGLIVPFDTDMATTRMAIPIGARRFGKVLVTSNNGTLISQRYKSTAFNNTEWKKDSNWEDTDKGLQDIFNKQSIYNVTYNHPLASGTYYTLETAIAAVPSAVRKIGMLISFFDGKDTRIFRYKTVGIADSNWLNALNWLEDLKTAHLILAFDTDKATTRKQVVSKYRKKGMILTYVDGSGVIVNEQYLHPTAVTDNQWCNNEANWQSLSVDEHGINTRINALENDVESLGDSIETLNSEVEQVKESLGDTKTIDIVKTLEFTNGGINKTNAIGATIAINATSNWQYAFTVMQEGVVVKMSRENHSSTNYPFFAYATDVNDIIIAQFAVNSFDGTYHDYEFTMPSGSAKLWITRAASYDKVNTISYEQELSVRNRLDGLDEECADGRISDRKLSDAMLKRTVTTEQYIFNQQNNGNKDARLMRGEELQMGVEAVMSRRALKQNTIKIALITDTHTGGTRTEHYDSSANIARFVTCANAVADVAVHCGDIITNYQSPAYMPDKDAVKSALTSAAALYRGCKVPLMMVKGNHDLGLATYTAIPTPSSYVDGLYRLDDNTSTYVSVSSGQFAALKAAGATFYTRGVDLISNAEYYDCVQSSFCQGAVFGEAKGGYYYRDISDKLRLVVLNQYYVQGDDVSMSIQEAWLPGILADAKSRGMAVATLSHQTIADNAISASIRSFMDNGGVYVGHIHGHEHQDKYDNSKGYNDIGVNWGCILNYTTPGGVNKMNAATYYGFVFDIFEIDLDNGLLYENRVGYHGSPLYISEDRVFSISNQKEL